MPPNSSVQTGLAPHCHCTLPANCLALQVHRWRATLSSKKEHWLVNVLLALAQCKWCLPSDAIAMLKSARAACSQVHRLEATLRSNREALEVEVHATEAQAERLKGEVAALRSIACDTLAESETHMQELQAHCDSAIRWGVLAATEGQQCEPCCSTARGFSLQVASG